MTTIIIICCAVAAIAVAAWLLSAEHEHDDFAESYLDIMRRELGRYDR